MFINHVTTNPFFTPTQYGIDDASALLGTTSQWTGSETSDIPEMVNAFEAAIAGKADGIAVAIVDTRGVQRPDPGGARRRDPGRLVQRRRPQRPPGLRRPGPLRFGRGDGPAHRRARRRGQGRLVHRHARPAQHPAADRRGDPGDQGLGRQHRVRAGRDERRAARGAQPHRSLVPRQHRRRRHVRRRRRQHAGGRPGRADPRRPIQRV